jgi:hypothetical protein
MRQAGFATTISLSETFSRKGLSGCGGFLGEIKARVAICPKSDSTRCRVLGSASVADLSAENFSGILSQ